LRTAIFRLPFTLLSLPAGKIIRRRRCVRRQLCNFRTSIIRLFKQASESEVTTQPGGRAYISLGSLPSRQFRYLKRRIASLVRLGNPASKRCSIQPRALAQALPPGPVLGQARRYHVLFLPRLPTSTWILGLSTTTPNLSLFTQIFGWCKPICLCHSDSTNSRPSQLYYMSPTS